jgi:CHASE1-domain containing sensor protein
MDFDNILAIIVTTVIVPLLTWGVTVLISLANTKIAQVKSATVRAALESAKDELYCAVQIAVTETQETFVKALKAEGKFDAEAARTAFNMSFARTKEIMSNAGIQILQDATDAANKLITAQIEAVLKDVK